MPDGFITVTEAERTYRISQKTIRKWIRDKILPAQEVYVNGLRQYAIATSDIEAIIAQKAMGKRIPVDTSTATEQRLTSLEHRVAALEAMLQPIRSTPLPIRTHKPTSDDLPDDLIACAQFAQQHGIPITTVQKAISSGRLQAIHGTWKQGRAIVKHAFDASERARFYELFHENSHFVACSDCPH